MLYVLAIGIDKFGDKAGGLHLDYAAKDAHDVASELLESQKGSPGKPTLYADVSLTYLPNDKADSTGILDALDDMARRMASNETGQDVAVVLVSSHGEMIGGQFYLEPYGFDAGSQNKSIKSAVSASELEEKLRAEKHAKLCCCSTLHSGAVGAGGWAPTPTPSPPGRHEPHKRHRSDFVPKERVVGRASGVEAWRSSSSLLGRTHRSGRRQGNVSLSALTNAMEKDVVLLTKGRQHLGMHVNFGGDLFLAGRY